MQLGASVTDKITGFTGVVTGFCQYITGCNQALVQPRALNGGKKIDPEWFDVQRLDVEKTAVLKLDNGATPGFDRPAPRR